MKIQLIVKPKTPPMSWDEFCVEAPPFSIALDGYVSGGPEFEPFGPRANFNHHEEVNRLATRATCAQVLMAIRMGLFKSFQKNGKPYARVYVNDCDEDVCLSWFLLNNPWLVIDSVNPMVNRLVNVADMLDTTAGAYPFSKDMPFLEELAWIYQPYRSFRLSGALDQKNTKAFASIITDVSLRISQHIVGRGSRISLDTRYELIGGGKDWSMISEIGEYGRMGAFSDGVTAFVAVRERESGIFTYSIGRLSPFIPFDIRLIFCKLNAAEKIIGPDRWGGGDTIGGSPRVSGSKLTPSEVQEIINCVVSS